MRENGILDRLNGLISKNSNQRTCLEQAVGRLIDKHQMGQLYKVLEFSKAAQV